MCRNEVDGRCDAVQLLCRELRSGSVGATVVNFVLFAKSLNLLINKYMNKKQV